MSDSGNFEIKNQHFNLMYFIFGIILSGLFFVGYTIRMLVDRSAQPWEWCILIFPAVLLLVTILGIIACYKTVFSFKDGIFTYKTPLKKAKAVSVESISYLNVHISAKGFNEIIFMDKSEKAVLSFIDDGTVIICKAFIDTLNNLNIPINYV